MKTLINVNEVGKEKSFHRGREVSRALGDGID